MTDDSSLQPWIDAGLFDPHVEGATDFESLATGLVADHGGRLVKLIGDAIMFVAVEPTAAVAVANAIIDVFDGTPATPAAESLTTRSQPSEVTTTAKS
jgi:class 3 adenylate cyclase